MAILHINVTNLVGHDGAQAAQSGIHKYMLDVIRLAPFWFLKQRFLCGIFGFATKIVHDGSSDSGAIASPASRWQTTQNKTKLEHSV